jgi:hypothetical protein
MKTLISTLAAASLAFAAPCTFAQGTPGYGPGGGPGKGQGWRFNADNTTGWSLMTAEERTAHRDRMLSFKTYDECQAYRTEHHAAMQARAKEKGLPPPTPRQNVCDSMKSAGRLN